MSEKHIIISTAYNPPIEYFYYINKAESVSIEIYESFQKQTYRNRCEILGPNGRQKLGISLSKGKKVKEITKDIKIHYAENWIKNHIKSIETAYNSSAYFIHYAEEIFAILNSKPKNLIDLNTQLLKFYLDIIGINTKIEFTEKYIHNYDSALDLREKIHPKKQSDFKAKNYPQVFEDRFKFVNNLSILDLIFNMGPESQLIIEDSTLDMQF